ncbi:protein FAM47E isoform X2 [Tupaia chinensis]|uniref:protein FAM47E isoform X2 n=1 Tax=Tupaia chinensis TaxID=246437 RepID=UPI0003C8D611|nr:protein FAM47E isoform X2 [Tupaia chinensis]
MEDHRQLFPPCTLAPGPEGLNCRPCGDQPPSSLPLPPSPVVRMTSTPSPGNRENPPFTCFTKPTKRLKVSLSLNSRRWVFVRKGLDDFRTGCPPCEGLITRGPEEVCLPRRRAPERGQKQLALGAALCSKLSPAQRARKAFVEDVEAQLAPHPLALYPNLEEAMPVQLLLQVLEVLDPARKLEDAWAYCQDARKGAQEPTKLLQKRPTQAHLGLPKKTVSHSRQWCYKEKSNKMDLLRGNGPPLHEDVRKGVSDFCSWVTTIGSADIGEDFILQQFDVDYHSKPSCDVLPATRLNQVPPEMRHSVGLNDLQGPTFFQKLDHERKVQKPQNPDKPKYVKMRYGAWYLSTKLWKKQRADEPLVDPKVSHNARDEDFKKELQKQEELLADLHGTAAFKDFILSRGYRMPKFLEKMSTRKACKY